MGQHVCAYVASGHCGSNQHCPVPHRLCGWGDPHHSLVWNADFMISFWNQCHCLFIQKYFIHRSTSNVILFHFNRLFAAWTSAALRSSRLHLVHSSFFLRPLRQMTMRALHPGCPRPSPVPSLHLAMAITLVRFLNAITHYSPCPIAIDTWVHWIDTLFVNDV